MQKNIYEFVYTQTGENIIEWRQCDCGEEFPITDKDIEFYEKVSPIIGGQKYTIPAPTKCPDCRQQRRLAFRNERKLYRRNCDYSGKPILSCFSPDMGYKVFEMHVMFGNAYDSFVYGREFDFSKTFFEQFDDLMKSAPMASLMAGWNENSEYVNFAANNKDCYLIFGSSQNENCYYSRRILNSNGVVDCSNVNDSRNCYQSINVEKSENVFYSKDIYNSTNCYSCLDLVGCDNCINCHNLRNKKYCINNVEYTKEEFDLAKQQINYNNVVLNLSWKDYCYKYANINLSEDVCGDDISNSKNIKVGFEIKNSQDCKYIINTLDLTDSSDVVFQAFNSFNLYEVIGTENSSNCFFSFGPMSSSSIIYSFLCVDSKNNFGCVGLKNKEYCILNKQYTKEEYEQLVPQIIEHMKSTGERGEFFPLQISPFGYNDTLANDYYPLKKEQAVSKGFKRQDKEYPINVPDGIELVNAKELPDSIDDVEDDILKKAVVCEVSGKPFRIVKPELEFYRKHNLPLPRKHPDIRHLERLAKRAPRKLILRTCDSCSKQVVSVYPPEIDFKVFCEECYNKEVY